MTPALYDARTVHVRFAPFERRFSYRVAQIFLDVDRIGEELRGNPLIGYNRPGLFSFYDRDHGDRSGAPLRPWAERLFAGAGVDLEGGAIRLLCFPRVLGYVFNPISLAFGYGPHGDLRGVIYEVNNTFGETHAYVARASTRHETVKSFHVSPFFDVTGAYRFTMHAPGEALSLTIENIVDGARTHLATLRGKRRALTTAALAGLFVGLPFMTLKVIAAIHWEALFLWLRGAGYRRKPDPPSRVFSLARPEHSLSPGPVPGDPPGQKAEAATIQW
ncbi:MAG: DUF1365 family protein [Alphaproteobacteria bacterium]|nr:DUF1365 family protein [Alphaproteobacteria bacterium]